MKGFNPLAKLFSTPRITPRAPKADKATFIKVKDVSSVPAPRQTNPRASISRVADNVGLAQDVVEKKAMMTAADTPPPVWYIPNFSTGGTVGKMTEMDRPASASTAATREAKFSAAVSKGGAEFDARELARSDSTYREVMDNLIQESLRKAAAEDKRNATTADEFARADDRQDARDTTGNRLQQLDAAAADLKDAEEEEKIAIAEKRAESKKGGDRNRPALAAAHAKVGAAREKMIEIERKIAELTRMYAVQNKWKGLANKAGESARNARRASVHAARQASAVNVRKALDAAYARSTAARRPPPASDARTAAQKTQDELRAAAQAGRSAAQWEIPGGRVDGPPSGSRPGSAQPNYGGYSSLSKLNEAIARNEALLNDLNDYIRSNPGMNEGLLSKFHKRIDDTSDKLHADEALHEQLTGGGGGPSNAPRTPEQELAFFVAKSGFDRDESQHLIDHGFTLELDTSGRKNYYQRDSAGRKSKSSRAAVEHALSAEYIPEHLPSVNGAHPPPSGLPKARPRSAGGRQPSGRR